MSKYIKMAFALLFLLVCIGCITEPKIEATKSWEGHFYSLKEVEEAIKDINLDDGESIWMISNHTLYRLLKNTGK